MKERITAFLGDIDLALQAEAAGDVLDVYHIGRSALVWQFNYVATTQDFDILRPHGRSDLVELALRLFGQGTAKAREHGLYLQVVEEGFPPVPSGYKGRAIPVEGNWTVLRIYHLEPHDMAATKLRRFSAKDRADIRLLCDVCGLDPEQLETTLEAAYPFCMEKDGDEFRDSAFRSLRTVQRYLRGEISEF
jgi:hypothetical protein